MTDKSLKDKTIDIKGKRYAQVKDRIQWLDENKQGKYSIDTDYKYFPEHRMWVVKAILTVDDCHYSGLAQEVESDDYRQVNATSALENAETSAIGRACAAFGLGIQESYASSNEMVKAQNRAVTQPVKYATEKQIDWIRNTTAREFNLEHNDDIDRIILEILTIPADKVPLTKVKAAVDKITEAAQEERKNRNKSEDIVVEVTDYKTFESYSLDDIPY